MTTPTGTIRLSDVNVELGYASNRQISMGDAEVRDLAEDTSGAISMNQLRGKSDEIREPASGEYYTETAPVYMWSSGFGESIYWNSDVPINYNTGGPASGATSWTYGGWTYYRGSLRVAGSGFDADTYGIYRIQ